MSDFVTILKLIMGAERIELPAAGSSGLKKPLEPAILPLNYAPLHELLCGN
jgi:hypothetical protein